jgi:hypothetical protein
MAQDRPPNQMARVTTDDLDSSVQQKGSNNSLTNTSLGGVGSQLVVGA